MSPPEKNPSGELIATDLASVISALEHRLGSLPLLLKIRYPS